jgi:hypothetical protein
VFSGVAESNRHALLGQRQGPNREDPDTGVW